jgi:hypothetical protein
MNKYKKFLKEHKNEIIVGVFFGTAFGFSAYDALKWRAYFAHTAVALKELELMDAVIEHLQK